MASMVHADLGPPPSSAPKYKEDPVDDHLRHPNPSSHQGSHPHGLQPSRSMGLQQLKQRPGSPHEPPASIPPVPFSAPHSLGSAAVLHHQTPYGQHPQEPSYYASHPSSYTTVSAPGPYGSSGPPDIMAATAQMQRTPYTPMYHSSQSSPPTSVTAQAHNQHGRNMYTQSPQMTSQIYGYHPYSPINSVQPSPYAPRAPPQQHPLNSSPVLVPHPAAATPVQHHPSPTQAATAPLTSSPNLRLDTAVQQPAPSQRPALNSQSSASTGSQAHAGDAPQTPARTSSSAAPGPIPATTPLVVRQDTNGVQWINFEYSRERIKLTYTIRCDVESVDVGALNQQFKNDNCVYPRACCSKSSYKGNRLVYETECNSLGWALASLNPQLRGKRGLIQRAVDSWRNSNQDSRLRSRRVRRMEKLTRRQTAQAQASTHAATAALASPVNLGMSASGFAASGPRSGVAPLNIGTPHMHHHHAREGSASQDDINGSVEYVTGIHRPSFDAHAQTPAQPATNIRTAQAFQGYPAFPPIQSATAGPSMPPLIHEGGVGPVNRNPTIATSTSKADEDDDGDDDDDENEERNPSNDELFGCLPEGRRRKFILVEDSQRKCRVRVRATLDQVNVDEIPDSYRMANSVYPRTYFPVQLKDLPGTAAPGKRSFKNDREYDDTFDTTSANFGGKLNGDENVATVGRTMVPAPSLDGESEVAIPKLSKSKRKKDIYVNDMGYRMSWSQSRVFAGRMLFLQRSLDAYRNKMRSTMLAAGHDASTIPEHFETRTGKRRWLEQQNRRNSRNETGTGTETAAALGGVPATQHSVEEVEP